MPTPYISPWGPPLPAARCSPAALSESRRFKGAPLEDSSSGSPVGRRRRRRNPNALPRVGGANRSRDHFTSAHERLKALQKLGLPTDPEEAFADSSGGGGNGRPTTAPGRYEWDLRKSDAGAGVLNSWENNGLVSNGAHVATLRGYYRRLKHSDRGRFSALSTPVTMERVKALKALAEEKKVAQNRADLEDLSAKRRGVMTAERQRRRGMASESSRTVEPTSELRLESLNVSAIPSVEYDDDSILAPSLLLTRQGSNMPEASTSRGPGSGADFEFTGNEAGVAAIQARYRGRQARRQAAQKRKEAQAEAERQELEQQQQHKAATKMQARHRGHTVRRRKIRASSRVSSPTDKFDEEFDLAVLKR